jgi:hypothetical protein
MILKTYSSHFASHLISFHHSTISSISSTLSLTSLPIELHHRHPRRPRRIPLRMDRRAPTPRPPRHARALLRQVLYSFHMRCTLFNDPRDMTLPQPSAFARPTCDVINTTSIRPYSDSNSNSDSDSDLTRLMYNHPHRPGEPTGPCMDRRDLSLLGHH